MILAGFNDEEFLIAHEVHADWLDILGPERLVLIDEVISGAVSANLLHSWMVAETGALRWNPNLRPEVLIDAMGRLL